MPGSPMELQQAQSQVSSLATADLASIWTSVSDFDQARTVLNGTLPDLVDVYGQISAAQAAEWYMDARALAKIPGSFTAVPATIDDNATAQLTDWAVSTGFNLDAVHTLVEGGLTRRVISWGRKTIVTSTGGDPTTEGWMRVGRPTHCDWCTQYLDGEVHTVEGYDFPAHDHCHCMTVPVFSGRPAPAHLIG